MVVLGYHEKATNLLQVVTNITAVPITQYLVFRVVFCKSLFVLLYSLLCHCIICSSSTASDYTIVSSVLLPRLLITPLYHLFFFHGFWLHHYIICSSTASDYTIGIFKFFLSHHVFRINSLLRNIIECTSFLVIDNDNTSRTHCTI